MGFALKVKGALERTFSFLHRLDDKEYVDVLNRYGREGVMALSSATPRKTGKTAASWDFHLEEEGDTVSIVWTNSNSTSQDDCIALMLQYGHGTGTGGYVAGIDYINPAIRPIFEQMAETVWKVVTSL